MTRYEELLEQRKKVDQEIKKLEEDIWGLDEIGETLLLEPVSFERN